MRVSKSTIVVLISMVLFSIVLANVLNLLSTNALTPKSFNRDEFIQIGKSYRHLNWFLQISDIHISTFKDPNRITDFKEFCQFTIDAIKPSIVLASGDLTDAKTSDAIGSQQYESEWKHYKNALDEAKVKDKTVWLDVRGNHDSFNVATSSSKQNFFTNYSVQGKTHPRSYLYQQYKGGDLYTFIAVDACLEPGPKRPFNFVGVLDEVEVDEINGLMEKTRATGTNYTIWFGHFPTSCILSPNEINVRDLIGQLDSGLVYLCGHLHTLGGLVPRMYSLQKAGFMELELGDWKDNRMYRILAVDHGLLSFIDIKHNKWPVALITNPKNALFYNPMKENLLNMQMSTHIRVLAFSLDKIQFVKVRINDEKWKDCYNINGPLYVVEWDPKLYLSGLHFIEVMVRDVTGRESKESHSFSLDGTKVSFGFLPKIALMTNVSSIFKALFGVMVIASIAPLCILRYINKLTIVGKISRPKLRGCGRTWLRKLWVLSSVNRLFWPLVLYPIYLIIGPWSIGYLVEDHIGVIFAWGIFVKGSYLPGSFTYAYGFVQLLTFQLPLTFILANVADQRFKLLLQKSPKRDSIFSKAFRHIPFMIIFSMQVILAYLFWLAYGTMAFFLGPLRTWSIFLAMVLYWIALNLPENCTKKTGLVWNVKQEPPIVQDNTSNESAYSE